MEKVSVIIPVYNVEQYLDRCIQSVINQTFNNIEIILINDGSIDNSQKICENYAKKDSRIILINQENMGVSNARNIGINKATGDYITFVDSDDYVDNRYVETLHKYITKYNADVCVCSTYKVYSNGKIEKEIRENGLLTCKEYLEKLFNLKGFGVCRNNLYKSTVIKDIEFDSTIRVGEDFYFNLNASKNIKSVIAIDTCLYYYFVNNNSLVRKFNKEYDKMYYYSSNKVVQYIEKYYSENNTLKKMCNNYVVFNLLLVIVNYVCHSDNTKNIFKMRNSISFLVKNPLYKKALKECDMRCYNNSRKIAIVALKLHFFMLVALIGKIRQCQIKNS